MTRRWVAALVLVAAMLVALAGGDRAGATSSYQSADCHVDVLGCISVSARVVGSDLTMTEFDIVVATNKTADTVEPFVIYWGAQYHATDPTDLGKIAQWPPSWPGVYAGLGLPQPQIDCNVYVGCGQLIRFPVNWTAPECGDLQIYWFIEARTPPSAAGNGTVLDSGSTFTFDIGNCVPSS